jgi:hypothetical protein
MPVTVQRMTLMPADRPDHVEILIGDASSRDEATVWIKARFAFQARPDQKLAVLVQDALDRLQNLIDEGKKAAQAPPSGNP